MGIANVQILIAMGIYLLFTIGISLWYSKKSSESAEAYFLGGRGLGPWVAAMSAEASDMSGWLLMGLPGVAYFTGAGEAAWTAIGLAIAGDEAAGFQLTDRFSRTFGVFREALDGTSVSFDPVFTNDLRLPEGDESFVSCRLYRPAHNIGHFRYVECTSLDAQGSPQGDITPFAEVLFPFDPSLRSDDVDLKSVPICRNDREGPLVRERYALDSHGIVEVTITDLDSGYESVHRLVG